MKAQAKQAKTARSTAPPRDEHHQLIPVRTSRSRKKISTTIAPEGYAFLERLITSGKAKNLAGAIDIVLDECRRLDNRARLERATAAYYENGSQEALTEENELAGALSASLPDLLFDE